MSNLFTLSNQELQSDEWVALRQYWQERGWDWTEAVHNIAKFRMTRAEARAKAMAELAAAAPSTLSPAPATLVHYNQVKQFWDFKNRCWTRPDIVYIGRAMFYQGLTASPFANPFRIDKDTNELRTDAIELYANWIMLPEQAHLLRQLDELRGKTLVCWCHPRHCHGDVLLKLMQDQASYAEPPTEVRELAKEGSPEWQPALNLKAF